jgi:hypothetical protein
VNIVNGSNWWTLRVVLEININILKSMIFIMGKIPHFLVMKLHYYVRVCIIFVHHYVIMKVFQTLYKWKKMKASYNVLWVLLSEYSIVITSDSNYSACVSIIYWKHFNVNTLKICNINTIWYKNTKNQTIVI